MTKRYWIGSISDDPSDPENWSDKIGGNPRLPTFDDDVIFGDGISTPCTLVGELSVNSLTFDDTYEETFTISAGATLNVTREPTFVTHGT